LWSTFTPTMSLSKTLLCQVQNINVKKQSKFGYPMKYPLIVSTVLLKQKFKFFYRSTGTKVIKSTL
jgi:hypothetical protein